MRGATERRRSGERLRSLARAALDPDGLRLEVVTELRRTIGFAFWCWTLVDPESRVTTGGMSEALPFLHDFRRYITLMEREADVNSYRALMGRDPGRSAVGLLGAATGGALWRSVRQREVLAPAGVGDELRVVLQDGHGCWGFLNLYRAAGEPHFNPDEGGVLADTAPVLAAALRRSLRRDPPAGDAGGRPPGVLVLDEELRLRAATPAARWWLRVLSQPPASTGGTARDAPDTGAGDGDGQDPPLPTAVYAVAARLLGQEAGVDVHRPPRARVRLAGQGWAVIHAARLDGAIPAGAGIAVTIEAARPGDLLDLVSLSCDVSPRERALMDLVRSGLGTRQIAERLCISPYTVQDHLKAIFHKVGVQSRGELVSKLDGACLGVSAEDGRR